MNFQRRIMLFNMKKECEKMSVRGQLTIFVIMAILLVASVALVFSLTKSSVTPGISASEDPAGFIRTCAEESASQAEKLLLEHSGFIDPNGGSSFVNYNNNLIAWMCYTPNYDDLCTNKHPMLRAEIEKQIYNYIKPKIDSCFSQMKSELSRYDYKDETQLNLSVQLLPNIIKINIGKKISYVKDNQKVTAEDFDSRVNSPLFNFVLDSIEIANQEVNCNCPEDSCNADILRMNADDPRFEINKPAYTSTGMEVYSIAERLSGKQIQFALRNCVKAPIA